MILGLFRLFCRKGLPDSFVPAACWRWAHYALLRFSTSSLALSRYRHLRALYSQLCWVWALRHLRALLQDGRFWCIIFWHVVRVCTE